MISYMVNNRYKTNKRVKSRMSIDILYKLSYNIRSLISISFKLNNYSKKSKTNNILGCSFEEFKKYLESKFEPWMNWDNKGLYNGELNYGWDIDHIIPSSSAKNEEELIKLNHYTNLQPLCSKINRDIKETNYNGKDYKLFCRSDIHIKILQWVLDNNIDPNLFNQFIFIAQEQNIQEILGYTLYIKYLTDIANTGSPDPTGLYKDLMDQCIQDATALWAIYHAIPTMNFRLTNKAMSQKEF